MRKKAMTLWMALLILVLTPARAATGSQSYIPDDCGKARCTCFIQLGDAGGMVRGIVELLKEGGYLDNNTRAAQFTPAVEAAVIALQRANGLPPTGMMDDDTLTLLVWGMLPEALDRAMPVRADDPSTFPDTVYVPTDGGDKRHFDPECSDMYDPRKVSIRNAQALGYEACKKCAYDRERSLH